MATVNAWRAKGGGAEGRAGWKASSPGMLDGGTGVSSMGQIGLPVAYTDPSGKDAAAVNFGGMVAGFGHEGILSIHQDGSVTYARFGPVATDNENAFGLDALGEVRLGWP